MKRIAQAYTQKNRNFLPLLEYIAQRKENDLIDFLESKNIDVGTSQKSLIGATIKYIGKEHKKGNFQKAIKELYSLHPDKNVILELFSKNNLESFQGKEVKTEKENFLKTPLFRLLAVIVAVLVLIIVISKIGD